MQPTLTDESVCVCGYLMMEVKFHAVRLRNTAKRGEGKSCPGLLSLFSWRVPFQGHSRNKITNQLQPSVQHSQTSILLGWRATHRAGKIQVYYLKYAHEFVQCNDMKIPLISKCAASLEHRENEKQEKEEDLTNAINLELLGRVESPLMYLTKN